VRRKIPLRDIMHSLNLVRTIGPHGNHHVPPEFPAFIVGNVGAKHGDILLLCHLPRHQPGISQRLLPGKRTPQQEANHALAPNRAGVRNRIHQLAVPPDPVLGNISTQIRPGRHDSWVDISWSRDGKERARPRVFHAECQKVLGVLLLQRHKICLYEAIGTPTSLRGVLAAATLQAKLLGG